MISMAKNNWLVFPKPKSHPRLRLFCFPCAGGAVSTYVRWAAMMPADIELCVIHLPGRGKRLAELPFVRLSHLLPALMTELQPYCNIPSAFLGHSMGAILAFEAARYLRHHRLREPLHLFCCSCPSPQTPTAAPPLHALPEAAFVAEISRRYAAIPDAIQKDREMLQLFLPGLRADFALLETYTYQPESPLNSAISVYGGQDDTVVSRLALEGWRQHTNRRFELAMFEGNHFFVHSHTEQLIAKIAEALTSTTSLVTG